MSNLSSFAETEREALLHKLEEQQQQIERQQAERREMSMKIQQMESKLISGGKDIVAHTAEQEETLRQKKFVEVFFSLADRNVRLV